MYVGLRITITYVRNRLFLRTYVIGITYVTDITYATNA